MTFSPRYSITNTMVNHLTRIVSAREVIEQSPLVPKWEAKLRRQALVGATHSSTAIEGNRLTRDQVGELADGREVMAAPKDRQEVLNYLAALKKVPELAEKKKLAIIELLAIHKMITRGTLQDDSDSGAFRTRQVFIGRRVVNGTGIHEVVEYMPPPTEAVPRLVAEFITWLNSGAARELNPVLLAGIAHYEIARIHPFIDGNGRTARLLAVLVLCQREFDTRQLFALDEFYDRDRKAYYAALKTVQQDNQDLTRWLEYFTAGVAVSVMAVKDVVRKLGSKQRAAGEVQTALTKKQMGIVDLLNTNGKVTNRELRVLFRTSAQAVHKELMKLVRMKVIKPVGQGRSRHYILS